MTPRNATDLKKSVEPAAVWRMVSTNARRLAVNAVTVLVHVVAIPVLNVGADCQRVGARADLGGERDHGSRGRWTRKTGAMSRRRDRSVRAGQGYLRRS